MNLETPTFWIIAFAGVLAIYGAFMAFSRWCLHSPAVPDRKLRQLQVGMTQAQVSRLLGQAPRRTVQHDRPEWLYGHRLKQHRLRLFFTQEGTLRHFEHVSKMESHDHEPA